MKTLLSLTVLALAWLQPQIAEACSPPYYESPDVDRGFDAAKSPSPELLDIYTQTYDDNSGCGVENSCGSTSSVSGEIASDVPITHVAIGAPGSFVDFGSVYEVEEGIYSFTLSGKSAEGLRFYDANGYHSAPASVDVPSDDTMGGCSLSKAHTSRYATLLFAMLLAFGWRKRRRS